MNEDILWDVLSDGNRRHILTLLDESDKTPKDLLPFMTISASGLSKHLRRLKDSGLIKEKKQGRKIVYSLDRKQTHDREKLFEVVLDRSMRGFQEYFKNKGNLSL